MKKSLKKLTLTKETLRSLEEGQMSGIAGGNPQTKRPDCYTMYTYCGSCGIACTVDCVP